MVWCADDNHLPALILRLGNDLMDAGDVGAGGVNDPVGQGLMDCPALPVGADDDRRPLRDLLRRVHHTHAQVLQIGNDALIVDDGAQHDAGPAALGGFLRHMHRPADPVAEARGAGQLQPHRSAWGLRASMRPIKSSAMARYSSEVPLRPATFG